MITVNKLGIILAKTEHIFESEGVLNPAVIKIGETIHLFYRAVTKDNYSTIGYCTLSAPMEVASRNTEALLFPEFDYEFQGLEDPRIVKIDELFYLAYTAYDGINALGALATSKDLITWHKHGIIVPQITYEEFKHFTELEGSIHEKYVRFNNYQNSQDKKEVKNFIWDKNLIFFPRKIDNKFCFFHRIKPDIQIVVSINSLDELTTAFWQNYFLNFDEHIVLSPKYDHEVSYIGSGCPPIETP